MHHVGDFAGNRTCGKVVVRAAPVRRGPEGKSSEAAAPAPGEVTIFFNPNASIGIPEMNKHWSFSGPSPRGWAELPCSKLLDTVEDIGVIARRTFQDSLPG